MHHAVAEPAPAESGVGRRVAHGKPTLMLAPVKVLVTGITESLAVSATSPAPSTLTSGHRRAVDEHGHPRPR